MNDFDDAVAWLQARNAEVKWFRHRWLDLHGYWQEEPRVRIRVGMQIFEGHAFWDVFEMAKRAAIQGRIDEGRQHQVDEFRLVGATPVPALETGVDPDYRTNGEREVDDRAGALLDTVRSDTRRPRRRRGRAAGISYL